MLVEVAAMLGSGSDTVRPVQAPSAAAMISAPRRHTFICMRVIDSVGAHTGTEMPVDGGTCRVQARPYRDRLWQIGPGLSWERRSVVVPAAKRRTAARRPRAPPSFRSKF